jgi:hypothetical protein
MEAATSVSTRDSSTVLYPPSNVYGVSRRGLGQINVLNSLIVGESVKHGLIRVDLPKLSTFCIRRDKLHVVKTEWTGLDHIWHLCRVLPLVNELLHHCNSASVVLNDCMNLR